MRLDKWLWHARFFRTRSRAASMISTGRVRINGTPVRRPSREVAPGDTLTFPQGHDVRLVRVVALADRRGPASEARRLFVDLDAAAPDDAATP